MTTISTEVEFYPGLQGPLFRLIRTPEYTSAHLLFIAPLFEQANQIRHHVTRSAINAYHQGIQSIIFDHYGTGDSGGELTDASLVLWQQDIIKQLLEIKAHSTQAIYLSVPLSAVLLLSDNIIKHVAGIMLLQPDFNGKRFVQQFKRLALAAKLANKDDIGENKLPSKIEDKIQVTEIAGYVIQSTLLDDLAEQSVDKLTHLPCKFYWFEWQLIDEVLSPSRAKQQKILSSKNSKINQVACYNIDDVKFWQATELKIAQSFLVQEELIFTQLVSHSIPVLSKSKLSKPILFKQDKFITEQGVIFTSKDKQLFAIEHLPTLKSIIKPKPKPDTVVMPSETTPIKKGVIIVVGGPQTRVGSHRLFVYLARALAKQGLVVLRFDYNGAGDSEGNVSNFTDIQDNIDAAIKTFQQRHSDITDITLWGLCDAASAILLYLNEYSQQYALQKAEGVDALSTIKQVFLINPWVRQEHTQAKAYLRSYYIKRFLSKPFWIKLLSGKVQAKTAYTDIQGFHQQSQVNVQVNTQHNFVTEMLAGLNTFTGHSYIALSGKDLTADEFSLLIKSHKYWRAVMARGNTNQHTFSHADHTFSNREQQNLLINFVCNKLTKLEFK